MNKTLKRLNVVLLTILILVVIVVIVVNLFANRVLKAGIETAATKTLNVGVSLEDVDLSIIRGRLGLEHLVINNPPGYQHDKLLELRSARIAVDVRSLVKDVVNIGEIRLDGMNVVLEQRGISGNNLQDVIKAIPAGAERETKPESAGRKLHVDNLEISDITVKAKLLPVPGKADTITLNLSPIRMTDLGAGGKLDTAALSGKILLAIANSVAEQGAGVLPKEVTAQIRGELKRLEKLPQALLEEGVRILEEKKDLGKDVLESGKDIGKEVTEGLKGLLKQKKKQ